MLHIAATDLQRLQWALENGGPLVALSARHRDADIDATDAWQTAERRGASRSAVVDQSVDAGHPDLLGNVAPGQDFTQPDGCTAGCRPAVTTTARRSRADRGRGDNGEGIAGVAPRRARAPAARDDHCGDGKLAWVLNAFAYAGEARRADRECFLRQRPGDRVDPGYNAAFARRLRAIPDTLFVVAAGNEGNDNDATHPVYPCATKRPARTRTSTT